MSIYHSPFDQFQRYFTVSKIVENLSEDKDTITVLEVGANGHFKLLEFLPKANITFSDIEGHPAPAHINFIKADATNLPFKDGEFDFVVSTDVLEHVPSELRDSFILECFRVSKVAFILACPVDNGFTPDIEKITNDTFKNLHHGTDFRWLKEHEEQGLPRYIDIDSVLDKNFIPYFRFNHGRLDWWKSLMQMHFIKEAEPALAKVCKSMDEYYNRYLYQHDVGEYCYRSFWVIGRSALENSAHLFCDADEMTEESLKIYDKISHACENIVYSSLVNNDELSNIRSTLISYNEQLSLSEFKLESVNNELASTKKELDICNGIVESMRNSRSWKVTRPLRLIISLLRRDRRYIGYLESKYPVLKHLLAQGKIKLAIKAIKLLFTRHPRDVKKIIIDSISKKHSFDGAIEEYEQWVKLEGENNRSFTDYLNTQELASPKLSILVPVYNANPNHLIDCINSVVNQSYQNWELCIVDDASTNKETIKTLQEYAKKHERIKIIFNAENKHISATTNIAFDLSTGDYILLLDHDDMLADEALLNISFEIGKDTGCDLFYSDEDHIDENGKRKEPFFKPDWSPTLLLSHNYIGHLVCMKRSLMEAIGGFRTGFEGAQDYDLLLRASLATKKIKHIPKILYHWREHQNSTALNSNSKPYAHAAGQKAIQEFVDVKYKNNTIDIIDNNSLFTYKSCIHIKDDTKVAIIIPTKDKVELLEACINSINECKWGCVDIIIINNGSVEDVTYEYFNKIQKEKNIKVIDANIEFNWSKLNNIGASYSEVEFLVFLNNDTVVISKDWLRTLCSWASLDDVAVVGPQLLYEDNTIQHAGVVVGMGGWADHIFKGELPIHRVGPFVSPAMNRNVLAVTGACQVIEKRKFDKIGGFDEDFIICGSDVEICIRAHEFGYQNLYIADVSLYHLESKSRSSFIPDNDFELSKIKYEPYRLQGMDPFFNKNLDLMSSSPKVKL